MIFLVQRTKNVTTASACCRKTYGENGTLSNLSNPLEMDKIWTRSWVSSSER
jgi:hypothetical protein